MAFHQAEKRARARGLTDEDIEREQEDDDSQFWVDVWMIAQDLDRFTDHKSRFLRHQVPEAAARFHRGSPR